MLRFKNLKKTCSLAHKILFSYKSYNTHGLERSLVLLKIQIHHYGKTSGSLMAEKGVINFDKFEVIQVRPPLYFVNGNK